MLISIIILTWNNQEHIQQAIQSCLLESTHNHEVIIVNNGSTDNTRKIIDYNIENIENTYVIHNIKNLGPGMGRNMGVKHASGEYLMFLDGDDWLEPGAIEILTRILKKHPKDLLIFNHKKIWPDGREQINIPNKHVNLNRLNKDLSNLEDRKLGIQNIHCCWNKIYKKAFIDKHKIKFPQGIYEDLFWSITASVKANDIFYIGKPLYNYRQRTGSITKSITENHFDFFKQVHHIFKTLENDKKYKYFEEDIKTYLKNQALGILSSNTRIANNRKHEFKLLIEQTFQIRTTA